MRNFDQLLDSEKNDAVDRCKNIVLDLLYYRIIVLEDTKINNKLLMAIDESEYYSDFILHPKTLEPDIQLCVSDLAEIMASADTYN